MYSAGGMPMKMDYRTSYDVWKPPFPPRDPMAKQIEAVTDSVFNKAMLGLVAGGGGGFVFGVILGAMPGAQMDSLDQTQKAERVVGMRPKVRPHGSLSSTFFHSSAIHRKSAIAAPV